MPLTLMVALALGGFYLGVREQRQRWFFLSYTALGMGLLFKGPIAVVLPGVVVLAAIVSRLAFASHNQTPTTHARVPLLRSLIWGIPWTLALSLPWYVLANGQTNNQIWEVFVWYHNIKHSFAPSS